MVYADKSLDEDVDLVAKLVKAVMDTYSRAKRAQIVEPEAKPVTGSRNGP